MLLVDAPAAVKWLVAEPGHEHAMPLLLKAPTLLTPDLIEIYDGVYLAAAEQNGVRLATADARLARKCPGTAYAERVVSIDRNSNSQEPA